MSAWTHRHTHNCLICRKQIRYSCCQQPDSFIPNSCQRDCLQFAPPHRRTTRNMMCVVSENESKCLYGVGGCVGECALDGHEATWDCLFMCAWMKASFSSLFAIILSPRQKHQAGRTPQSRHLPPCVKVCVCVGALVFLVAPRCVSAHFLSHPLFLSFPNLSSYVSLTMVNQNFVTLPVCACVFGEMLAFTVHDLSFVSTSL